MFKRRAEASAHQDLCGGPTLWQALGERRSASGPVIPTHV